MYDTVIDDPKILALSMEFRWYFLVILSAASRQFDRGSLPTPRELGLHLRTTSGKTKRIIEFFIASGFVDEDADTKTLRVHGWNKRQFKSDVSTDRVQRFREEKRNVSETPPHVCATDTETDTDTEKNPPNPPRGEPVFVLPDWIPQQDWDDWIKSRKKKPTVRAKELAVERLAKLKAAGHEPATVLQQSILGSWTGLFAVKPDDLSRMNGCSNGHAPAPVPLKYLNVPQRN
jgi:hypothetical protein